MSVKDKINKNQIPEHIAIIMDGNGRWAKKQGKNRVFGHKNGVKSVREVSEACAQLGVKHLTLYAFSTENWKRPKLEIYALMELLVFTISSETNTLMENNICLKTIGDISKLPEKVQKEIERLKEKTKYNTRMELILALNYSSRQEIVHAIKKISQQVKKGEINIDLLSEQEIISNLYTAKIPDPELLIRTSGELRLSNFLLWQTAYTELYFTEEYWPEFNKESLYKAMVQYQSRERRFGKISEQLEK